MSSNYQASKTDMVDLDANKLPGEAAVLKGGIKEWVKQYQGNDQLVTVIPDLS